MNNKELTELRKEFEGKFRDVKLADRVETISVVDKDGNLVGKKEIWSFFLPHLKSNEIKGEAYILGYKAGWGDDAVYKTNGELEKEAKESFDGNKSLLGLTQKESNE